MGATPIVHLRESGSPSSSTSRDHLTSATPAPERDNPLTLLRDAIARVNSSNGSLPDQVEAANLLAEARRALERANAIVQAVAQCEESLKEARFDKAYEALDAALLVYPGDPALVLRRDEVRQQQEAFAAAAAVRKAIEEANWFLGQDRLDLAVQFLKERVAELPLQPELIGFLKQQEACLPEWQRKRDLKVALERAAELEQVQQGEAAKTILEEALRSYPESEELVAAVQCLRGRLATRERQKKLARRLELIAQKVEAQAWSHAINLLDITQPEFPGTPELESLRDRAEAGRRRSECEVVASEVRRCLADGELEQAEQALAGGRKHLGADPELEALREELESEKKYRESLCAAQVCFGRRRLQEAECILAELDLDGRPEAKTLLEAVRQARVAADEQSLFESGREKALELIHQQEFAQAADLLNNLLLLFPDNPILQRELATIQRIHQPETSKAAPPAEGKTDEGKTAPAAEKPPEPDRSALQLAGGPVGKAARSGWQPAAIAGIALLVLASAAAAAWKLSHPPMQVPKPAAKSLMPPPAPAPAPITPAQGEVDALPPLPPAPPPSASGRTRPQTARAVRQFTLPQTNLQPNQAQQFALPTLPGIDPTVRAQSVPTLPAGLSGPANLPAPPRAAPKPAAAPAAFAPAKTPPLPVGGRVQQPETISQVLPSYPNTARANHILGTVRVEAVVDEQGNVRSAKAVSGPALLRLPATDAVLKWKYKPGTLNGRPVASTVTVEILFKGPDK